MVGSLLRVGEGRWSPDDLEAVLKAADRTRCGPMAPAGGLYLAAVSYDDRGASATGGGDDGGLTASATLPTEKADTADSVGCGHAAG